MFGMDFGELLLIAIVAIIFLGPDKLPETMLQLAKTFKKVKSAVANAKDSIEEELHLADIKNEALAYKKELMQAGDEIKSINPITNIQKDLYEVTMETQTQKKVFEAPTTIEVPKTEEITFTKKETIAKEENI